MRADLHSIHGHKGGKDPISQKKLEKDNTRWAHLKEIMGLLVGGKRRIVRLLAEKANAIADENKQLLKKARVAIRRFRSVVTKLFHAAMIMPALQSPFLL